MKIKWSKWKNNIPAQPLVSVIIPTKDRPEMLQEAVNSVLNQSYSYVEAVVINDAGCDVSHNLESFTDSSKISYLNLNNNSERSASRNYGISAANGHYIAYLDDDDIFYSNHIETLLSQLKKTKYKVAYTDSLMAQQSIQNGSYTTYKKTCYYSQDFDFENLLVDNYIPILCLMHEKNCLEKSGYFDTTNIYA
jgi:glycosyltransferase involved in cell wall biosynthesis